MDLAVDVSQRQACCLNEQELMLLPIISQMPETERCQQPKEMN